MKQDGLELIVVEYKWGYFYYMGYFYTCLHFSNTNYLQISILKGLRVFQTLVLSVITPRKGFHIKLLTLNSVEVD